MIDHNAINEISETDNSVEIHEELGKVAAAESRDIRLHLGLGAYDSRGEDFDADDAYQFGLAYGDMISGTYVVGRDHRENSPEIKAALTQGLEYQGAEIIDIGLAPTDMVSHTVQTTEADAGVAVTASHMPPGYHGLKPLNNEGRIFDSSELDIGTENYLGNQVTRPTYKKPSDEGSNEIKEQYIQSIVNRYNELFDENLSEMKIGLDPGNGIGTITAPRTLRELGVEEDNLYIVNSELDPKFSGRNPDPTEDSLEDLTQTVLENNLDVGIALDGDADRAVYVNEKGEKVQGDQSLAILGEKYLSTTSKDGVGIACSGDTSALVQEHMADNGGIVQYQPVGAVFPAKAALENDDPKIVLGGQPNGHFLDPEFTPYDSGTLMTAIMPGIINQQNTGLSNLQEQLPEYMVHRENEKTQNKEETLRNRINALDEKIFEEDNIVKGIKNGQVITIRPSGTEPYIRKMVETPHPSKTMEDLNQNKTPLEIFQQ